MGSSRSSGISPEERSASNAQESQRTFIKSARTTSRKAAEQLESQLRSQAHGERYLGHKPTLTFEAALNAYAESRRGTPNHRNLLAHRDTLLVLLDTGARYGEIANLEWRQIDLEGRQIRLWRPKVQNESVIFMTDRAHGVFGRWAYTGMTGHVFKNKAGGARGYSAIAIRKALRRAGLAYCTIHTLRHTHATRLIQNGLSLYEVRSVLGHPDINTRCGTPILSRLMLFHH